MITREQVDAFGPCDKCGFENEYIIDYHELVGEYVFCGNCGTEVLASDIHTSDRQTSPSGQDDATE